MRASSAARSATSNSDTSRPEPRTLNFPSRYSTSASAACSSMAATRLPFSITLSAVTAMAPPTYMAEREATAPKPGTSRAESPEVTVTASGAMPSRRAATRPNTV